MAVWIGNVAISFLSSQDNTKEREVIERNFVDESPSVYEFPPRLENGTFSIFLIKDNHPDDLTLAEQRRAFVALSEYHPSHNTFELLQDKGWLSFSNISTTREPNNMAIPCEADIRYLENADYRPAYLNNPAARASGLSLSANGFIALHPDVTDVKLRDPSDGSTTTPSVDHIIPADEDNLDVYSVNGNQLIYENPSTDGNFGNPEENSVVEASDSSGSPFFSGYEDFASASANNSVMRTTMTGSGLDLDLWDDTSDSWNSVGALSFSNGSPVMEEMDNHYINISMDDGDMSMYRGRPFVEFDGTFSSFTLDTSGGDDPLTSSSTSGSHSITGSGSTYTYFISRNKDVGTFSADTANNTIDLTGIDETLKVSIGYISDTETKILEWSQTDHQINRNLLARETL